MFLREKYGEDANFVVVVSWPASEAERRGVHSLTTAQGRDGQWIMELPYMLKAVSIALQPEVDFADLRLIMGMPGVARGAPG